MGCIFTCFTSIVEINNLYLEKKKPVEKILALCLVFLFLLQIFLVHGSTGALQCVAV